MKRRLTFDEAVNLLRWPDHFLIELKSNTAASGHEFCITPGGSISDQTAEKLFQHPDLVERDQGLFPGISQSWALVGDHKRALPQVEIYGSRVKLDRSIDQHKPCCENFAAIHPGQGPHAAELKCSTCGRHRGWVSKTTFDFLTETFRRFGVGGDPPVIQDTLKDAAAMTNIDKIYPKKPSPYLKAEDLQGKEVNAIIEKVAMTEVRNRGGVDEKPVATIKNKTKKLILNGTNGRVIKAMTGTGEIEEWVNVPIVIFPTTTDFPKPDTPCIRLKPPKDYVKPEPKKGEPPKDEEPTDMDDEIPF